MTRIVIIGAGFAGINAARVLANQRDAEVLIVDRQNYHLFQPLLYQVAAANIEQEAIAYPVRAFIRNWKNVGYQMADVKCVDLDGKAVVTQTDERIEYDKLIIAAGAVTNFFGMKSVEQNAYDLKYLDDAVDLRNRILRCFEAASMERDAEKRRALMTFVIVGAGPTGVEYAGALAELVKQVLVRDYPTMDVNEARIILIDAIPQVLAAYDAPLQAYAIERLKKIGVEVMLEKKVIEATGEVVRFDDGDEIAGTLVWAAGVKAAPLAETLGVERKSAGRVVVTSELTLPNYPDVYVIGDMAYVEQDGELLPMMAPVAMQQGTYAGKAIAKRIRGQVPDTFRYFEKGTMAVIGRGKAVARIFGINTRGFIAWGVWLVLHLFYLIGFKNRLIVLLSWAYDYFTYDRKVRLITG